MSPRTTDFVWIAGKEDDLPCWEPSYATLHGKKILMRTRMGSGWTQNLTHIAELRSVVSGAAVDAFYLEAFGSIPTGQLNSHTYRFDASSARRICRAAAEERDFDFVVEWSPTDQYKVDEAIQQAVCTAPLRWEVKRAA